MICLIDSILIILIILNWSADILMEPFFTLQYVFTKYIKSGIKELFN